MQNNTPIKAHQFFNREHHCEDLDQCKKNPGKKMTDTIEGKKKTKTTDTREGGKKSVGKN
jgi:hypothetical protein